MDNPFEMLMRRLDNIEQILLKQQSPPVPDGTSSNHSFINEPSSTDREIAEHLNCAVSTVLRYRRDGVIPSYQAGRTFYFKKSEVDAALSTLNKSKPGRSNNKISRGRA